MTSIWPASIFRPSRAIRSNASKSPEATAAPCCMATTPSAASSTSSPRPAPAAPPVSIRAEAGVGSFNQRLGSVSATANQGAWSTSFFGNGIKLGRISGQQRSRRSKTASARSATPRLTSRRSSTYPATISSSDSPAARTVNPSTGVNELVTDRTGTDTPFDYGNKQGANATAGFTKTLWNGAELIVDGGVRDKKQQAGFFGNVPLQDFNASYVDTRSADVVADAPIEHQKPDVRVALNHPDRHRLLRCDLSLQSQRTPGQSPA